VFNQDILDELNIQLSLTKIVHQKKKWHNADRWAWQCDEKVQTRTVHQQLRKI
jgi:hypothetical protein